MTTIHTRQLQQYTQDNYNNTHKTHNNTHKTTHNNTHNSQYTRDNSQQYTQLTIHTTTAIHTRPPQLNNDHYHHTVVRWVKTVTQ